MTDTDFSKTGRLGRSRCSPWIWDNLGEAIHWWEASGWKYANCSNFTKILLFGIFQNKWHRKTEKSLLLGWVTVEWLIVVKEARFQLLVSIVALNPALWVTKCAALNHTLLPPSDSNQCRCCQNISLVFLCLNCPTLSGLLNLWVSDSLSVSHQWQWSMGTASKISLLASIVAHRLLSNCSDNSLYYCTLQSASTSHFYSSPS